MRAVPDPKSSSALALIRHTRPLIAPGLCYGRSDVPAAPFDADAERLAAAVAAFAPTRVVSSPRQRCRVLADHLAARTGAALAFDARLAELDFGDWEMRRWDDIPRPDLDRWAADVSGFAPPGGESGAALVARVSAAYRAIAAAGGRVAVIAHAGPLRVMLALAEGAAVDLLRPGPALGSMTVFEQLSVAP